MKVLVDTNIVIYAAGQDHPAKAACVRLLRDIGSGQIGVVTDVEVLQELLYRYWRRGNVAEGLRLCDYVLEAIPEVLPVVKTDLAAAKGLLEAHREVEPRDAVHAAVMLNNGLRQIYSYDHHFDDIPGLTRLEP